MAAKLWYYDTGKRHLSGKMHNLVSSIHTVMLNHGISPDQPVVLACSGGRDSMALLHALLELGFRPIVAHANFQLRGEQSDKDEMFIRNFCQKKDLKFFSRRFHTSLEAKEHGESIQMAARRLRYSWLFDLMEKESCIRLLTAHHDRDQAETLLLNLMRGTGAKGLAGMKEDDGRLLRPMLKLEYPDIEDYAQLYSVPFREDASNKSDKYKRNFIRHVLLSPWEERYPGTIRQISRSAEIMYDVNAFLDNQYEKELLGFIQSDENGNQMIDYSINLHPYAHLLMRFALMDAGLADQAPFIMQSNSRAGALFSSDTHELLADRKYWILRRKTSKLNKKEKYWLPLNAGVFTFGTNRFELKRREKNDTIPSDNNTILLTEALLQDGVYLSFWKQGDAMHPFGMKGHKKISDLFIDAGVNRFAKEQTPILRNKEDEILWLCGMRASELLRLKDRKEADWILTLK